MEAYKLLVSISGTQCKILERPPHMTNKVLECAQCKALIHGSIFPEKRTCTLSSFSNNVRQKKVRGVFINSTWYMPASTIPRLLHTGRSPYTPTHMVQTQFTQNALNDVRCSDKCGKSMICQIMHMGLDIDTLKIQSSDWPKLHCALIMTLCI